MQISQSQKAYVGLKLTLAGGCPASITLAESCFVAFVPVNIVQVPNVTNEESLKKHLPVVVVVVNRLILLGSFNSM